MKIPRILLAIVFLMDVVSFNLTWWLYYWIRSELSPTDFNIVPDELWVTSMVMTIYWALLFFISGLYKVQTIVSRFSEILQILKTTLVGSLIISFLIFLDQVRISQIADVRLVILLYWLVLTTSILFFRVTIRTIQRKLLISGVLARRTAIIGNGKRAIKTQENIMKYPALGYKFIGYISYGDHDIQLTPTIGKYRELNELINMFQIEELILSPELEDRKLVSDVLVTANPPFVGVKIIPDLYDVVSGQARTNQIYGFPLINLNPHYFTPFEKVLKRLVDLIISITGLLLTFPIIIITSILIKLESKGAIFYRQERVGLLGQTFMIFKFRSMVTDAETKSGPVWAQKNDPRITNVGKIIRKYRIDEIPQLINVLKGEMSIIGPRPERQHFIEQLKEKIPFYERRLRVKPGITGLAQVKHTYDASMEDVIEKIKYDLYYIENMSFRMDLTILYLTIITLIKGKGQ